MKSSSKIKLQNFLNKAKSAVKVASDISDVASEIARLDKKSKLDYAKVICASAYSLFENGSFVTEDLDDSLQYIAYPRKLGKQIKELVKSCDKLSSFKNSGYEYDIFSVYGTSILCQKDNVNGTTNLCIIAEDDAEEAIVSLARLLWTSLGPRVEIGEVTSATGKYGTRSTQITLAPYKVESQYSSKLSTELYSSVAPYLHSNEYRSFMFFGPPGTGKTCLIKDISSKVHNGMCLVLQPSMLGTSDDESIQVLPLVKFLKPTVLIIDDFDRIDAPEKFLHELEKLKEHTRLLLVSVNHVDRLPKALVRPGRFDELVEITTIGDDVFKKVTRNIPEEILLEIKEWPIAHIVELNKRIDSGRDPREEMEDLKFRLDLEHRD